MGKDSARDGDWNQPPYTFPYSCMVHKPDSAVEYYEAYKNIGRKYTILKRTDLLQDIFTKVLDEFKATGATVKLKLGGENVVYPTAKPLWSYDCANLAKDIIFEGQGRDITTLISRNTDSGNIGMRFYKAAFPWATGKIIFKDMTLKGAYEYRAFKFEYVHPILQNVKLATYEPRGDGAITFEVTGTGPNWVQWQDLEFDMTHTGTPTTNPILCKMHVDNLYINSLVGITNAKHVTVFTLNNQYGTKLDYGYWLIWGTNPEDLLLFDCPEGSGYERQVSIDRLGVGVNETPAGSLKLIRMYATNQYALIDHCSMIDNANLDIAYDATTEERLKVNSLFKRYGTFPNYTWKPNRARLSNIAIGTSETTIPHGICKTPPREGIRVLPRSDAGVWSTKAPDATNIYLAASVACNADILVEWTGGIC